MRRVLGYLLCSTLLAAPCWAQPSGNGPGPGPTFNAGAGVGNGALGPVINYASSIPGIVISELRLGLGSDSGVIDLNATSNTARFNAPLTIVQPVSGIGSGGTVPKGFDIITASPPLTVAGVVAFAHQQSSIAVAVSGNTNPGTTGCQCVYGTQAQLNVNPGYDGVEAKAATFTTIQNNGDTTTNSDFVGLTSSVSYSNIANGTTNADFAHTGAKGYGASISSTVNSGGWTPALHGIEVDSSINNHFDPTSVTYDSGTGNITLDFASALPAGLIVGDPVFLDGVSGTAPSTVEGTWLINAINNGGTELVLSGNTGQAAAGLSGGNISGIPYRFGINLLSVGNYSAGYDAAINISTSGGSAQPWRNGIALIRRNTTIGQLGQGIDVQGSMFIADTAITIKNWAQMTGVTVSGNIMKFPNYTVTGAGAVTATSLSGGTGLLTIGTEDVSQATPTVASGHLGIGKTTVAAGSGTCPTGTVGGSTVAGCLTINVGGSAKNVPYF